jgi:hypothetical protein
VTGADLGSPGENEVFAHLQALVEAAIIEERETSDQDTVQHSLRTILSRVLRYADTSACDGDGEPAEDETAEDETAEDEGSSVLRRRTGRAVN